MTSTLRSLFSLVAALLLGVSLAVAQSTSATVTGAVSDPNGAAISGASVILENLQTHLRSSLVTNSAGFYRVSGLLPGFYRATVTRDGFKSVVRDAIELHGQDEVAINYSMQIGSVNESITVTSGEPLLQSESATVSTVIEAQQIQTTPLNGRNVMNLSALTPGVVPQGATSGNALGNQAAIGNYTNPAGWGNYQIGGAITGGNTEYVDGGPLNLPISNWMGLIPSQDSIQEFRVETNNISPEYGRYYGGVINFSTKSGTNDFHGSVYEYFRNTVLDANSYFNNLDKITRPPVEQNQYGLAAGGPIKKDKAFFFTNWEGYANRSGLPYRTIVPSLAETTGDFTADAPVYYSGTTNQVSCNGVLNKVCPDPTALYMASVYKYWAAPNIPGAPQGAINFATNASSGTNSNQFTLRTDYSLSPHQQWFARYTLWKTNTLGTNYYHNNVPQPEVLSTSDQVVLGDTITLTPTTVADVRASYLRFLFTSQPPDIGHVNLSDFGPAYGALQGQATFDVLPVPFLAGYGNPFPILIINVIQYYNYDTYNLSANVTKTLGRNAIRFGGAARRVEAYLSGLTGLGPTGFFVFIPGVPTTNEFANFMMGVDIPIASNIGTGRNTDSVNFNQGYYVYDTFHANSRLTLTGGVRWELPGALSEKHDLNTVFLPALPSPLGSIQNPATSASQALTGNLTLVHSSAYPSRNDDVIHYHLFAPNLGFSFGILRTVLRGGFGMSYVSLDAQIPSPQNSPITSLTIPALGPLSNPFPQIGGKLPQPVGRDPNFSAGLQGLAVSSRVPGAKYPYVEQWNLNIQHQLSPTSVFQIGYQGSKGTHIELNTNINQLPDSIAAQAAAQYTSLVNSGLSSTQADAQTSVNQQVANPLAGRLAVGSAYNGATIAQGQLLRPYPQFGNITNLAANFGSSSYHSLQATFQRRFQSAGNFFAAYTWAKLIGTVDSRTGFLEGNTTGNIQDYNNLYHERSIESFDVPQRLVLNYSLALPVGKGQLWMQDAGAGLNRIVGGWRFSSITSFQTGYPLALTAVANDLANDYGSGTIRPDRVPGCNAKKSGSATARLSNWFNTACFVQPPTPFSYGNEARVDAHLRGQGIDNWDLAVSKETNVTERIRTIFEAEFLNAFNRVQFGPPGLQVGGSNFGEVTSTLNNPRQIQFALRVLF
jgi:hypothetical protein